MQYFILLPGDTEADCIKDTNILGESNSFGTFYASAGLKALNVITNKRPDLLESITIIDERKKRLTVEQFIDIISKLKVRFEHGKN
jgi:hypothetical protein